MPARQAASFSGVLATINQLAGVPGIAVAGTIYLSAGRAITLPALPVTLLALASAPVITGTGVSLADARARRAGRRHQQARS
jgi:hypothetical protein